MTPRGIRNNNPGNVDYHQNTQWDGLSHPPTDGRFCRFTAPEYGIRAIAKILLTYQTEYGLRTIRGLIGRWAPPNENETASYVAAASEVVGISPDSACDVTDAETMGALVRAIIRQENGSQPYGDATITNALSLAGLPAAVAA